MMTRWRRHILLLEEDIFAIIFIFGSGKRFAERIFQCYESVCEALRGTGYIQGMEQEKRTTQHNTEQAPPRHKQSSLVEFRHGGYS